MIDTTSETALPVNLPAPELPKGEREYRAFLKLLPTLLQSHRGEYVAIHEGQAVDFDKNDIELVLRVQNRFGYIPIYVGLVTERQPVFRVPHYRHVRK